MTKIMLVEDDKSLREIYGVRLLAEGYDIVSAGDGEEALAMAIKERPQLIVSDVMMPKISGFDMLDILRSTTETKEIKVIMMTALSSEEQRSRGESLGADRYLVKSQVGIEDVVRVVHEVLGDNAGAAAPAPQPAPATATPLPTPAPAAPAPVATPAATPTPPAPQHTATPASPTAIPTPMHPQAAAPQTGPAIQPPSTAPKPPSLRSRIIQPLNDPNQSSVDMDALLNKELEKEATGTPEAISTEQESALIDEQLAGFAQTQQPEAETSTPAPESPPTPEAQPPVAETTPAPAAAPAPSEAAPLDDATNATPGTNEDVPGINIGPDGAVTAESEDKAPSTTPPAPAAPATPPSTPQQPAV